MLNIEAIYHEYLQKENTLNREKYKEFEGWFNASTAGSCFKKSMFRKEGVSEPEFDRRVMRLLRLGTVVHTDIQTAISDAWNSENDLFELFIEKQVKIPELNLVGHLDLGLHNKTSNQTLKNGWEKITMLLIPLVPHLAHECCEKMNKKFYWPEYNKKLLKEENCKIVVQVDGKKRGILEMPINSEEKKVIKKSKEIDNVLKYVETATLIKNIYIKNKLVNFITKK